MRTTRVLSFSLPPDLVREAERIAKQEGRTKSELFREALRRYVEERRWRALQRYGQDRARKLGMTEGDVGRGAQEVRRGRLRPALLVQPVPGWMWGSCRVAPRPVIVRTVIAELLIHELLVVAWTLPCSRPAIYDRRR